STLRYIYTAPWAGRPSLMLLVSHFAALAEKALDDHGDEDAFDDDADDRFGGGKPGLQRVEAKLDEEDTPVEGGEVVWQGVGGLLNGRDGAVEEGGQEEERGEGQDDDGVGAEDAAGAVPIA